MVAMNMVPPSTHGRTTRMEAGTGETDQLLEFVAEAARVLRSGDSVADVLRHSVRILVPELADLAVAFSRAGGSLHVEVAHRSRSEEANLRRVFGEHREVFLATAMRVGERFGFDRSRWLPEVTREALIPLIGQDGEIPAVLADLKVTSLLLHPLTSHGQVLGVLALARTEGSRSFTAAEFAAGLVLARRSALALEEAEARSSTSIARNRRVRTDDAMGKWAHTFEAASWGAAILDPTDWRIDSANTAFAQMHGYAAGDDLIGRPFADLAAPSARSEVRERYARSADESMAFETRHVRRDGTTFPVLVNVTVMHAVGPNPEYRTVHLQDLTELRRTEERLRSAQRMEAVGRLAGGVAHEVNNMMTIVLGFSDFLLRDSALAQAHREDVSEIQRAAQRAAGITQQLLAFSRQQVLHTAVLDLSEVVGSATQFLRALLPAHVRLETTIDAPDAWVSADRTQLEQVLINLAFNARDAMPQGGTLRIATALEHLSPAALQRRIGIPVEEGEYVTVTVSDTGAGMDPETLEHLFEPFFTTKGVGHGTGLGLSTVYGIVKQSGGYVTVTSEPGQGTTFCIFLPRIPAPPEPHEPDDDTERLYGHETVLVVEDEEAVRSLASRVLREHGYTAIEAGDGAAAFALLAERGQEVSLIVADLIMPLMGGRELRARLADLGQQTPVLFMSAYTAGDVRARGMLEAGDPFIQKPFAPADLAAQVRELLDTGPPSVVGG
jgi:PAS domain S-box-containing protein